MVLLAAWFEFSACAIRILPVLAPHTLSSSAIYFLHVAQILNALACPPISVTVTKLSCTWMGQSERSVTTAVAVVCNNLGSAVGMVLAPYLVSKPDDMPRLLWTHLGFSIFALVCTLAHFPAAPPSHPSPAAREMSNAPVPSFKRALSHTFRTPTFVALTIGGGAVMGIFNSWSGKREERCEVQRV